MPLGCNVVPKTPSELANYQLADLDTRASSFASSCRRDKHPSASAMAISAAHAQMAKILEMEKETHWLENTHLTPDEIQRQWAIKSAPLTAVLGVAAPARPVDLGSTTEHSVAQQTFQTPTPSNMLQGGGRRSSVCLQRASKVYQVDIELGTNFPLRHPRNHQYASHHRSAHDQEKIEPVKTWAFCQHRGGSATTYIEYMAGKP